MLLSGVHLETAFDCDGSAAPGPCGNFSATFVLRIAYPRFCKRTSDTTALGFFAGCLSIFVLLDMSFTAAKIHVAVFGVMTPCSLVGGYKPFGQKFSIFKAENTEELSIMIPRNAERHQPDNTVSM